MGLDSSSRLIESLHAPEVYDHEVAGVELLETHLSWVLLTGQYAYKIKKPVDLGFVDFTALEKRKFYCEEELRLNGRLAPDLYLDVVAITGSPKVPRFDADGEPIEFAVKMKQFSQDALLAHVLERDELTSTHIDGLAAEVARFHACIEIADMDRALGLPERIREPVKENFRHLFLSEEIEAIRSSLERLYEWTETEHAGCYDRFATRKVEGFIRECHGDMHLGNMLLANDEVKIFDCIEFNDSFRWIDVLSEIAFVVMDLEVRGRADFAWRFLNRYLEITGDYAGLAVFRYYLTYRAMVRAKVASIRLAQLGSENSESGVVRGELHDYLNLAERYARRGSPAVLLTHGLSGSGKTTGAQPIMESLGAIRIRSDIERKRIYGVDELANTNSAVNAELYSEEATDRTYSRLVEMARAIVQAGFLVVVDATFLKQEHRDWFRLVSRELEVPFVILNFEETEEKLRQRIVDRLDANSDASEATLGVLDQQIATQQPMDEDEQCDVIVVGSEGQSDPAKLVQAIRIKCGLDGTCS